MKRHIRQSIAEKPLNGILIITVLTLYFLNNNYLKQHTTGIIRYICVCHLNDYLCGVLFVAYSNIFLYTRGYYLHKLLYILLFCFFAGLFWEFVVPFIRPDSTSDWIDVFCYVLGGFTYWVLSKISESKNTKRHTGDAWHATHR